MLLLESTESPTVSLHTASLSCQILNLIGKFCKIWPRWNPIVLKRSLTKLRCSRVWNRWLDVNLWSLIWRLLVSLKPWEKEWCCLAKDPRKSLKSWGRSLRQTSTVFVSRTSTRRLRRTSCVWASWKKTISGERSRTASSCRKAKWRDFLGRSWPTTGKRIWLCTRISASLDQLSQTSN